MSRDTIPCLWYECEKYTCLSGCITGPTLQDSPVTLKTRSRPSMTGHVKQRSLLVHAPVILIWKPYLHFCLRYWTYTVYKLSPWKLGQGHPPLQITLSPWKIGQDHHAFTNNHIILKTRSMSPMTGYVKDLYKIHLWYRYESYHICISAWDTPFY